MAVLSVEEDDSWTDTSRPVVIAGMEIPRLENAKLGLIAERTNRLRPQAGVLVETCRDDQLSSTFVIGSAAPGFSIGSYMRFR
jgi:hypothetical protein